MFRPTPAAANDNASAPIAVFINEWMAANTSASSIADPADGDYNDWFELYNPGPAAVDLGGHFLTDNLTNQFQFEIPNDGHYTIPAGGHLLVWTDGESNQNSTNRADLHANFSLRAAGEAIGLFAPDGTQIDAVVFTNQTANTSMGRSPDGSANIIVLPAPSPRGGNSTAPPVPVVTSIEVTGVNVTLTFTTQPGLRYRVQFKDGLSDAAWTDLPDDVTAIGSTSTKRDSNHGAQRFYQVQVAP